MTKTRRVLALAARAMQKRGSTLPPPARVKFLRECLDGEHPHVMSPEQVKAIRAEQDAML